LLEKAAKKNGITTEKLLAQEVDAKPKGPSDFAKISWLRSKK